MPLRSICPLAEQRVLASCFYARSASSQNMGSCPDAFTLDLPLARTRGELALCLYAHSASCQIRGFGHYAFTLDLSSWSGAYTLDLSLAGAKGLNTRFILSVFPPPTRIKLMSPILQPRSFAYCRKQYKTFGVCFLKFKWIQKYRIYMVRSKIMFKEPRYEY